MQYWGITFNEGVVRVCGDAVLRYFWCGFAVIFFLLAVLRFQNTKRFAVIATFRSRFSVKKKVSAVMTLFRTVGIWLLCKREPCKCFVLQRIRVYNFTLWFAITVLSSLYLMWLTVLANDASTSWNSMSDVSSYSRTASCSRCIEVTRSWQAKQVCLLEIYLSC